MAGHVAAVTEADAQAARHLVDAWLEDHPDMAPAPGDGPTIAGALLELRGMVAQLAADCREAGYLEGAERGRRDVAALVRDALDGEGL